MKIFSSLLKNVFFEVKNCYKMYGQNRNGAWIAFIVIIIILIVLVFFAFSHGKKDHGRHRRHDSGDDHDRSRSNKSDGRFSNNGHGHNGYD